MLMSEKSSFVLMSILDFSSKPVSDIGGVGREQHVRFAGGMRIGSEPNGGIANHPDSRTNRDVS